MAKHPNTISIKMKTILDTIVANKKKEVELLKSSNNYKFYEQQDSFSRTCYSLKEQLSNQEFGIIAELKRKSPSAGMINENLDISKQGIIYQNCGVAGISCLTDTAFFGGKADDLIELRKAVQIPILRKEFIIDEFQLFESKAIGADAILLIAEILTKEEALHLTIIAQQLGLEVIMECHDRKNLSKINEHVNIIGINNRDLHLQKTDIQTSINLYDFIPEGQVCISESGLKTYDDLYKIQKTGFHGALIGESILSIQNPKAFIESLSFKKVQL